VVFDAIVNAWLVIVLTSLALVELALPRRAPTQGRALRWPTNITIGSLNILFAAITIAPVAAAAIAVDWRWGLFNRISVPSVVAIVISVLVLDALAYLQHRLLHASAVLWRVHRVHHADVDLDATTGLRFHPFEALISYVRMVAAVVILGLPPAGVAIYLWISAIITVLTHANVRLPSRLESVAQWLVVTPAMHAIHHSALPAETDRNFATIFSMWDRLGGTYRAEAHGGQARVRAGLEEFREPRYLTLPWTLALPFCAAPTSAAAAPARVKTG